MNQTDAAVLPKVDELQSCIPDASVINEISSPLTSSEHTNDAQASVKEEQLKSIYVHH